MTYQIRKAKPSDIEEIITLCAEHAAYEKAEYLAKGKADKLSSFLFSDSPTLFCLLAENETGILGYATFMKEFSTLDAAFYLHMDCLFLRPKARNLSIGEQIMKEIAKQAIAMDCHQIQWQTPEFNTKALKFYHRIGAVSKLKYRLFLNEKEIEKLAN